MASEKLLLKSTGAIGDAVVALAVRDTLVHQGYDVGIISSRNTLPLWPKTTDVFGAQTLDISTYLAQFPHTTRFTPDRYGHLCEWMARVCSQQLGSDITASRDNVCIELTQDEISKGKTLLPSGNPVVIMAPVSSTKNRNIPVQTIRQISENLRGIATACLLSPVPEQYLTLGLGVIGSNDLRIAAAALLAADVVITSDSGPLHLASGAVQGNQESLNANPKKIIAVLGSSHPEVVTYLGNQVVTSAKIECEIAPCGAHGYTSAPECVLPNYRLVETASCMMAISADEVTQKVLEYLSKQKE